MFLSFVQKSVWSVYKKRMASSLHGWSFNSICGCIKLWFDMWSDIGDAKSPWAHTMILFTETGPFNAVPSDSPKTMDIPNSFSALCFGGDTKIALDSEYQNDIMYWRDWYPLVLHNVTLRNIIHGSIICPQKLSQMDKYYQCLLLILLLWGAFNTQQWSKLISSLVVKCFL